MGVRTYAHPGIALPYQDSDMLLQAQREPSPRKRAVITESIAPAHVVHKRLVQLPRGQIAALGRRSRGESRTRQQRRQDSMHYDRRPQQRPSPCTTTGIVRPANQLIS
jgi:hypothetical protein